MAKPTKEQLEKINRFAKVPLTEDQVYVFRDLMIDDQLTAYYSKIHLNLLQKFAQDASKGVGLLMNHNSRSLPVGRSFDATIQLDQLDDGTVAYTLYGDFYIDLGRSTESNMTTDDIAKGIDAGTVFDTSIGFSADTWTCSICGNDIRDYFACEHFPGEKYVVQDDQGNDVIEMCYVIVGEDGKGELLENSLVYAGACNRATIVNNFSKESDREFNKVPKLNLVDDFKNIPLDATIYAFYTKDGSVLYTDTDKRTNGAEVLRKRSEETVELKQLLEVANKFGLKTGTADEFAASLESLKAAQDELATKLEEVESLKAELSTTQKEVESLKEQLSNKDATIADLTAKNEELSIKAGLGETYRQDLINKTIEMGVRLMGNSFNTELFTKFLETLSVDQIKEQFASFEKQVNEKFANARTAEPVPSLKNRLDNREMTREDFDDELEFRAKVAEEAQKYAKEHGVSLKEATLLMYKKLSKEGDK